VENSGGILNECWYVLIIKISWYNQGTNYLSQFLCVLHWVHRDFRFSNITIVTFPIFRIPKGFVWGLVIFIATSWRFPEQDHAILCQGKCKLTLNNTVKKLRVVVLKIFGLKTLLNSEDFQRAFVSMGFLYDSYVL
jgi:hypothetical protein